jgi:serpin B
MKSRKPLLIIALFVLTLALSACGSRPIIDDEPTPGTGEVHARAERETAPTVPEADLAAVAQGNSQFAFDLYHQVQSEPGNLIFSPFSISMAFAMVSAGARGETEAQIADTLHFTLPQEQLHPAYNALDLTLEGLNETESGERQGDEDPGDLTLSIANALWGDQEVTFNDPFLDVLALNYGAGMNTVDFRSQPDESREEINAWVEDKTEDRIKDLIPEGVITPNTRLVLTNAIYFYGAWTTQFQPESTADGPFTTLDGSQVTVPMMKQSGLMTGYASGDGWQAITMPYGQQHNASMVIILPDSGRFAEVESSLDAAKFEEIRTALSQSQASVNLTMPRWEFESTFDLVETLKAMGMIAPFEGADFSGITSEIGLVISDVIHKSNITVDEEGTEAAAATAIVMEETSAMIPDQQVDFVMDHPFIFAIVDRESGTLLFLGRVTNPAE